MMMTTKHKNQNTFINKNKKKGASTKNLDEKRKRRTQRKKETDK